MTEADYQKILRLLEQATHTVTAHQGELTETDIRIRHLLSITAMETKRRIRDVQAASVSTAETPEPA